MRQTAQGGEAESCSGEAQADGQALGCRPPPIGDPPASRSFARRFAAASDRLLGRVERACLGQPEWPLAVREAVAAGLALLAAEPALARLLLIEPYERGFDDHRRAEATRERLAALLRAGRERVDAPLPELVEEAMIGGLAFVVTRPLRNDAPDLLPALAPELTALLLTPYIGREEAERIAGL